MTEQDYRDQYPQYPHLVKIPKTGQDLTMVVRYANLLRYLNLRLFREFRAQTTPDSHNYWFENYDQSQEFQRLVNDYC